jgi:hypothetical protein
MLQIYLNRLNKINQLRQIAIAEHNHFKKYQADFLIQSLTFKISNLYNEKLN